MMMGGFRGRFVPVCRLNGDQVWNMPECMYTFMFVYVTLDAVDDFSFVILNCTNQKCLPQHEEDDDDDDDGNYP